MLKRFCFVFLCFLYATLVGCSSVANSNTLRNRNFDYERVSIENFSQPLKTPPGMTTPAFNPQFIIPTGQNLYEPQPLSELTPPGYNDVYEIPPVKSQPSI